MEQTTSFVVARQEDILSVVANAKDITNYDGELILRQDNRLAQESFSSETSYLEHRIILALLTVIERENNFEQWYKICVSALAVWSNSSVQAVYNSIEKIKQSLHSRCLCIMPENNMGDLMVIPWFVGLYTIKEDGWIFVKLNPSLSQWTNGLKENYMEEHLSACFDYKKHAAMILHNCFCSYFNYSTSRMNSIQMDGYVKEIKITIPSLRFLVNGGLDSPGYANTGNFFLRAVDPALKEINEKGYFKICSPPETPFRRATKYVDKPFYRLNKTGNFISSCVIYVMAGDKNTRLATQRLIDAKKEREKTLLKEQKNAIKTSLKEEKASNKTDLMEELINSMSKEEVILALEKAKSEREQIIMESEKIRACDISDFDYEKLTLRMASPFCESRPSNITFLEHRIILGLISVCQQNKILIGSIYCKIYISNLAVLIQSDKTPTLNALDKLIKNREKKCLISKNKISVPWFDDIFIDEKKQYLYFKFNMSLMLLFLPAPLFEREK